ARKGSRPGAGRPLFSCAASSALLGLTVLLVAAGLLALLAILAALLLLLAIAVAILLLLLVLAGLLLLIPVGHRPSPANAAGMPSCRGMRGNPGQRSMFRHRAHPWSFRAGD